MFVLCYRVLSTEPSGGWLKTTSRNRGIAYSEEIPSILYSVMDFPILLSSTRERFALRVMLEIVGASEVLTVAVGGPSDHGSGDESGDICAAPVNTQKTQPKEGKI